MLFFLVVSALTFGGSCRRPAPPTAKIEDTGGWKFQTLPERATERFLLTFRPQTDPDAIVRLVFRAEEDTLIELGPHGTRYGAAARGKEPQWTQADATPLAKWQDTVVCLEGQPHRWTMVVDGRAIIREQGPLPVSAEILTGAKSGEAQLAHLRFQRLEPIYFADSFMRLASDPSAWTLLSGSWELEIQNSPLRSANASFFSSTGEPKAAALVGEWFWDELQANVAVRPAAGGAVGLYLCYRNPEDYVLFRWTDAASSKPVKQLLRHLHGKDIILAETAGGYAPDQWYGIEAQLGMGWVSFRIDDTPALFVVDGALTQGMVGLHVEGPGRAVFDDVCVRSCPSVLANADNAAQGPAHERAAGVSPASIRLHSRGEKRLSLGSHNWGNAVVMARVAPWSTGTVGLWMGDEKMDVFAVRLCRNSSPLLRLTRTASGKTEVLAERSVVLDDNPHEVSLTVQDQTLLAQLDGHTALSFLAPELPGKSFGVLAEATEEVTFSQVRCCEAAPPQPLEQMHAVFSEEESMNSWSGALSDWIEQPSDCEGPQPLKVFWHRSNFYGDVRMDAHLKELPRPGATVTLTLNGGGSESAESALRSAVPMPVVQDGEESAVQPSQSSASVNQIDPFSGICAQTTFSSTGTLAFKLLADGKQVAATSLAPKSVPMILSLRRAGEWVGFYVDEQLALRARQPVFSGYHRIGWSAEGAVLSAKDIQLYSQNVANYTFMQAPTDWRIGSGIWEVTNRWQCDPRWAFFSGRSNLLAALWNKRPLRGDFSVEYYVANMMDRSRDQPGTAYHYAHDFDVTVCADGNDLTSGYSVVFGGFGNKFTGIYRKGEQWAVPTDEARVLINQQGHHHLWHHVMVTREGRMLSLYIDGKLVVAREDTEPLDGLYWALWTRNNGILVARVRVAAEELGTRSSPNITWQPTERTIYPTAFDDAFFDEILPSAP